MRYGSAFAAAVVVANLIACFGDTSSDRKRVDPAEGGAASVTGAGGEPSDVGAGGGSGEIGSGGNVTLDCTGRPIEPGPAPDTATGYVVIGYAEEVPKQSGAIDAILAHGDASCAIEIGGAVWCWGLMGEAAARVAALVPTRMPEYDGSLLARHCTATAGGGRECSDVSAVAEPLALGCTLEGRSLRCAGRLSDELYDIDLLASQYGYSCAIQAAEVWCWGRNDYGQLGSESQGLVPARVPEVRDAVKLSLSASQACALGSDGLVSCWGMWNPCGEVPCGNPGLPGRPATRVPTLPPAADLGQAEGVLCILQASGDSVLCRRANTSGHFGVETTDYTEQLLAVPQSAALVLGNTQLCSLTAGAVYCWGGNFFGAVGNGTWRNQVECPTQVLRWTP